MKVGDRVHWITHKADGTITEERNLKSYVYVEFDTPIPFPKYHLVGSIVPIKELIVINPAKDDPEWADLWEKTKT